MSVEDNLKKEENGGNISGKGWIFQFTAQSNIKTCFNKVHNNCQAFPCQIQVKFSLPFSRDRDSRWQRLMVGMLGNFVGAAIDFGWVCDE